MAVRVCGRGPITRRREHDALGELDDILRTPRRPGLVISPVAEARARIEHVIAFVRSCPRGERPHIEIVDAKRHEEVGGYRGTVRRRERGSLRVRFHARLNPQLVEMCGPVIALFAGAYGVAWLGQSSLIVPAIMCSLMLALVVRWPHELVMREGRVVLRAWWRRDREISPWLTWRRISDGSGNGCDVGLFDAQLAGDALLLVDPTEEGVSVLSELCAAYATIAASSEDA